MPLLVGYGTWLNRKKIVQIPKIKLYWVLTEKPPDRHVSDKNYDHIYTEFYNEIKNGKYITKWL